MQDSDKTKNQLSAEMAETRQQISILGPPEDPYKQAREALRESEEVFHILFEHSPDAILLFDPHHPEVLWPIVECNNAASRMNGYTREELIGQSIQLLSTGQPTREGCAAYLDRLRREGTIYSETVHRRKDGTFFTIEFSTSLITLGGRELVLGVDRDVTARKQAEEAMRRKQNELTDFIENAAVGLHWVAADGRILWANQAELDLLGYTAAEYIGHHITEFHADHEVIDDILERLTSQETLHNYEARLRCKDGSIRTVLISSNVLWEDGKFVHTRCFTRDITERKKAEEAQAAAEALRQADRLKSQFLASVSHELRTPLHHIKGYASTLLQRGARMDEDTRQEYLHIISTQSDQLARLIDDLLNTSQIESGKLNLDIAALQLDELVRSAVRRWQGVEGHHFAVRLPDVVPPIPADAHRLQQVLDNLLGNVVRYTPEHTRTTVSIQVREEELLVAVRDDGPGIGQEHLPFLFDRFYRAGGQMGHGQGSGLGLFICKGIIEQHGGRLWVETATGGGSTFSFSLPRVQTEAPGRATQTSPQSAPDENSARLHFDELVWSD